MANINNYRRGQNGNINAINANVQNALNQANKNRMKAKQYANAAEEITSIIYANPVKKSTTPNTANINNYKRGRNQNAPPVVNTPTVKNTVTTPTNTNVTAPPKPSVVTTPTVKTTNIPSTPNVIKNNNILNQNNKTPLTITGLNNRFKPYKVGQELYGTAYQDGTTSIPKASELNQIYGYGGGNKGWINDPKTGSVKLIDKSDPKYKDYKDYVWVGDATKNNAPMLVSRRETQLISYSPYIHNLVQGELIDKGNNIEKAAGKIYLEGEKAASAIEEFAGYNRKHDNPLTEIELGIAEFIPDGIRLATSSPAGAMFIIKSLPDKYLSKPVQELVGYTPTIKSDVSHVAQDIVWDQVAAAIDNPWRFVGNVITAAVSHKVGTKIGVKEPKINPYKDTPMITADEIKVLSTDKKIKTTTYSASTKPESKIKTGNAKKESSSTSKSNTFNPPKPKEAKLKLKADGLKTDTIYKAPKLEMSKKPAVKSEYAVITRNPILSSEFTLPKIEKVSKISGSTAGAMIGIGIDDAKKYTDVVIKPNTIVINPNKPDVNVIDRDKVIKGYDYTQGRGNHEVNINDFGYGKSEITIHETGYNTGTNEVNINDTGYAHGTNEVNINDVGYNNGTHEVNINDFGYGYGNGEVNIHINENKNENENKNIHKNVHENIYSDEYKHRYIDEFLNNYYYYYHYNPKIKIKTPKIKIKYNDEEERRRKMKRRAKKTDAVLRDDVINQFSWLSDDKRPNKIKVITIKT